MDQFSANLKAAREYAGLSIGQAARVTGILRARIEELECVLDDEVWPTEEEIAIFCRAYHVTEEGLRNGHNFEDVRADFERVPGFNRLDPADQEQVLRFASFLRVAGPAPRPEGSHGNL